MVNGSSNILCIPFIYHLSTHRSVRGRPGSVKSKSQYQTLKENGDVGAMSANRKTDDFDIKILQQKKHEAEVKRYVFHSN